MKGRHALPLDDLFAGFSRFLRRGGLRMTGQRRQILEGAAEFYPCHFDVQGMLVRLSGKDKTSGLGRATVYRTLELLVQAGILRRLELDSGGASYEIAVYRVHHEHMVCSACGSVIEFASPEIERLQDEVCADYGFIAESHILRITGTCAECAAKRKGGARHGG